jgi:polysaccharide biosynthesis transport protein
MSEIQPAEANFRTYLHVVSRRLHWVLAITLLAVAVSLGVSLSQKKQYTATAQLLVQSSTGVASNAVTQQTVSPTDVATELELVTSAPVKALAEKKLGFVPKISAAEAGTTNVINISATASSPSEAAKIANVYATGFVSYETATSNSALTAGETALQNQINSTDAQVNGLEARPPSASTTATITALESQETVLKDELAQLQVSGAETPGGVEVVAKAQIPSSPSSPKPVKDGVIALILGLVLGIAAAFAIDYFDDKVYTKADAERVGGGTPVLAMIPEVAGWKKKGDAILVSQVDPTSPVTEAYRSLRTALKFTPYDGGLRTILVTSASASDGKTSTVANLGVILAASGERVVIVSCDLRRPRLGDFVHNAETEGITSALIANGDQHLAIQPVTEVPGLALLGTGPIPPNPAELLGTDKAAKVFASLRQMFDVVLIDSPPILPVSDALILSRYADVVLFVAAAGETRRGELERAFELLNQSTTRIAGIVLNKVSKRTGGYGYGYGYGYGKRYEYASKQPPVLSNGHSTNGFAKHEAISDSEKVSSGRFASWPGRGK